MDQRARSFSNVSDIMGRIYLPVVISLVEATLFVFLFAPTASAQSDDSGFVLPSQPGLGVFNEGYSPPGVRVEPSKGVAVAEISFALLPARGGAQPSLRLVYSSDAGTRTAGVGWGLDLPSIELRPLSNPGQSLGNRFVFAGQPIVPICQVQQGKCGSSPNENMPQWAENWTYYRTQVEGSFERIFFSSSNSATWRVESKSGVVMEFGNPLIAPGASGWAGDEGVRWNLVRQFDTQGTMNDPTGIPGGPVNLIVYQWQTQGNLGLQYLSDIFDTPMPGADLNQTANYAHHTHLMYESHDFPNVSHALNWHLTPDLRLRGVDISSAKLGGTGPRELVRRYHLTYETLLHGSYLHTVQLEGRCPATESSEGNLPDVTSCNTMPPTTFKYAKYDGPPNQLVVPIGLSPNSATPLSYINTATVMDIDGDGLPDVVQGFRSYGLGDPTFSFYLNRGSPLIPNLTHNVVDGTDLFNKLLALPGQGGNNNIFMNASIGLSALGYWGNVSRSSVLWRNQAYPNQSIPDTYTFSYPLNIGTPSGHDNWKWVVGDTVGGPSIYLFADIDGDGLLDAVGTDNKIYFTSKDLSSSAQFLHPFLASAATNITIADPDPNAAPHPSVLVDMNGDGLPDYVTTINPGTSSEAYVYYPGDGTGQFNCVRPQQVCVTPSGMPTPPSYTPIKTPKAAQDPSERLPLYSTVSGPTAPEGPRAIYFHDINGDGLADIIVFVGDGIQIWLNDDGINFHRLPDINLYLYQFPCSNAKLTFADVNASGHDDIVLLCNNGMHYINLGDALDSGQPIRQGLLVEISNGFGATTKIEYASTATLDAAVRNTAAAWHDHSRKVQWVVTKLETKTNLPFIGSPNINLHSELDQYSLVNFNYTDPIYDEWQQSFLGFRKVSVKQSGDDHETIQTDTTYFFGPCQSLPPQNGQCPQTSDDDDWKAVTGVPVMSESFAVVGGSRLSTTTWKYVNFKLFSGMPVDSRTVRFAYPEQTDTWLYDESTSNFGSPTQTVAVPVIDFPTPGAPDGSQSEYISVSIAKVAGVVRIRKEETRDLWGNVTQTIDRGQIDEKGKPIDLAIVTNIQPATPTQYWRWGPSNITTLPFPHQEGVPDGASRALQFQYDSNGNLTDVFSQLTGSRPLDRFHENPAKHIAKPPLNASVDNPSLLLAHLIYDPWGNVKQAEGPQNGGGCQSFTYETSYQQLATDTVIFTGGCENHEGKGLPLKNHYEYDSGFNVVTASVTPTGAHSKVCYDGFGRMTEVYEPDATTGSVSAQPSIKTEYLVKADGPTQLVHTRMIDSPNPYRNVWTYLNGLGTPILVLSEADTSAGDGGQWVASGLQLRHDNGRSGVFHQIHRPWFFSGDPKWLYGVPSQNQIMGADAPLMYEVHYDTHGRIREVDDSGGPFVENTYHALSQDIFDAAQLDPNSPHSNMPSTVRRDGHGRVVASERLLNTPTGRDIIRTGWTYLSTGEVAGQSLSHGFGSFPDSVSRWMQYDSLGRLVLNAEPNTSYTQVINNCTSASSIKILRMHRPRCTSQNVLRAWHYAYDDAGHVVGTSDARGCGKNIYYDGAGRPVGEDFSPCRASHPDYTEPNWKNGSGTEAFYRYDLPEHGQTQDFGTSPSFLMGKLVSISDLGTHTRLAWDARGRVAGIARQLGKPDANYASLSTRYSPWWFRSETEYDLANRAINQSTGADVNEVMARSSKQIGGSVTYFYTSNIKPSYSARGLVTSTDSSYGNLLVSARYDADGALLHQVYGDAASTAADLSYDDRRNLKELKISRAAPALWSQSVGGYSPATGIGPSTLQLTLEDLVLGYDPANNPTSISDMRDPAEWPVGAKPISRAMTYDDLYRLTQIVYNSGGDQQISPFNAENSGGDTSPVPTQQLSSRVQQQNFSYDFLSNMTKTSDDALHAFYDRSLGTITNGTSQQSPNQILSAASASGGTLTAHYDASGDLEDLVIMRQGTCASPGGKCTQRFVYDWDEVGRLSRVRRWDYTSIPPSEPGYPSLPTEGPAADLRYKYDAGSVRVLRSTTIPGTTNQVHTATIFPSLELNHAIWDPSSGNYERSPLTETVYLGSNARVIYASQPLPSPTNSRQHVFFLIGDEAGSKSVVLDRETGEMVERMTFEAFGGPDTDYRPTRWANFRDNYRFTDKKDDIEVGLTYFGARYYHSALGRWISPDPLTIHALAANPNPYAFVQLSPLRFVDPTGLDDCDEEGGCPPPPPPPPGSCDDSISSCLPPPPDNDGGGNGGVPSGVSGSSPWGTPPPPPPTAAPAAGVSGTAVTNWTGNYVKWNPNATQPVEALLFGSETPVDQLEASLQANPDLALLVKTGGMIVLNGAPVIGFVMAVNTALDPNASTTSRVVGGISALFSAIPVVGGVAKDVQVLKNFASGGKFQNVLREAVGATKNNGILFHGGPLNYVAKPDLLSEAVLLEAKSGQKLVYFSKQLEAEMTGALVSNRTYVLVLGMETPVSRPVMDAIIGPEGLKGIAGGINGIIVRFDPVSRSFFEFVK
jgi:RHS repeat-associated protein